jgi:hypothetical protein
MKIEGYSVNTYADYFSYQSLRKQDQQKDEITEEHSSQSASNGDKSIASSAIEESVTTLKTDERILLKDLSASLLERIHQSVALGKNLGFNTVMAEAEALNFETTATVRTDNRSIELDLNVSLSRSFIEQTKVVYESAREKQNILMDPLIIELNGSFPTLSSKTFSFDIDSDGTKDQISTLGDTSAFLALDKNGSGAIENGDELFGAKSGNGFEELRAYDDDKNGWIDENDPIFNKLRIWHKTDKKDELIAIGEVGIGAIYLGDIDTRFEMKDSSNALMGMMRQSSFFLFENGKGGMISQIDLAFSRENGVQENVLSANNTLKKLQGMNSYIFKNKEADDTGDTNMEKLEKQLKKLEAKLHRATGEEKTSIQAQIQGIRLLIMALISL